jgi:putative tricarboxylic transport membrane protein
MNRDFVFGSLTLAAAGVYYALTLTIPPSDLADPIGPQGLPKTYAIVLAVLSIVLILRSRKRPANLANREPTNPEPANPEPANRPDPGSRVPSHGRLRVAGMLLIGIAYILVIPWLGYLLSVAMLIVTTTYFQGGPISRRSILVALAGAAFLWVLFIWLLRIQYPAGLWPSVI